MPSGKLRRALRGHGHHLSPIVQIGKAGVSAGVLQQVEQALADHELVKLRVDADSPEDRFTVADALADLPGANVVQILGRAILVYKRHPHHPRYEGTRAKGDSTGGAKSAKSGKSGKSRKSGKSANRAKARGA
jgi:RNA-binding protein